jgi:cyclic nucleotide-binding protein/pyridine nucleotide-disulfide oxidoreductase
VRRIGGGGDVKWIEVERDGKTERINVEGVFVFIGFKPVGRYLFKEHIDHDKNGYLITDQFMKTSIPGVYAAGDTRAQLAKQITTAVGDATTAVLHAERYIEELKDIERALPGVARDVAAESVSKADLLVFRPSDVVLREGEPADRFYLVIKGQAEATRRGPDGAEVVVNTIGPGEYFGEMGLLKNAPRAATVRAKTALEVMALDRATFKRLIDSSQATASEVRRVADERMRKEKERRPA